MAHRRVRSSATRQASERPSRVRGGRGQVPAAPSDSAMAPERLLALFAAKDLDALIDAAFDMLQSTVVCDFASAFYRSAGNGLLKERDSRGRESDPVFMRRYVELTPALPAAMADRGVKILCTRTILPRSAAELHQTAFYRDIMQPQGWRHAVSLCFWGDPPATSPVFVTSVYRGPGQNDFSERDIAKLTRLHPFIDSVVNRVHEREAATTLRDGMALAVHDGMRGFAILDRHLLLVQANHAARQLCAAWVDLGAAQHPERPSAEWSLPTILESECRGLHQEWQSLVRANPDAVELRRHRQVVHALVPALTVSVTMICPNNAGLAEPTFVLEFDQRVPGVALETPDRSLPLLRKLTAAERAVALTASNGLSNQEVADQLGKTVHAVKFLLHKVYQKTGVANRSALVAALRTETRRGGGRGRRRLAQS